MDKKMIIKDLVDEKETLSVIIHETERRLVDAPEGSVRVAAHGKGCQFYFRGEGSDKNGVYMRVSEKERATYLVRKAYNVQVKEAAERQYKNLERFLKSYDPDALRKIYSSTSELRRQYIDPFEISNEEYVRQWQSFAYDSKEFDDKTPEHYTSKGERVRSKSEVMIADALRNAGVPYRYECPLTLGSKIIHPDFTILRRGDRETLYWEHLGRMDKEDYVYKALSRIRLYEEQGYYQGIHLILTMETADLPINLAIIHRTIRAYNL